MFINLIEQKVVHQQVSATLTTINLPQHISPIVKSIAISLLLYVTLRQDSLFIVTHSHRQSCSGLNTDLITSPFNKSNCLETLLSHTGCYTKKDRVI